MVALQVMPFKKDAVLALECSTSQAKAMVVQGRQILALCERPYPASSHSVIRLDPQAMMACLFEAGRQAVMEANIPVAAIGLCGIWHSLLPLDENGEPLEGITTWADTASAPTVNRYAAQTELAARFYQQTGCVVHTMYPLWQLRHRLETHQWPEGMAMVSSQMQYMLHQLTGVQAVSVNTASGTGWLDVHTGQWSEAMLAFSGLNRAMMPDVCAMEQKFPLTTAAAEKLGLPQGTPVCCGGADGAMNQVGAAAVAPGRRTFSVGTSGAMRQCVAQPLCPPHPATWCYRLDQTHCLIGTATSGAGSCVSWFRQQLLAGQWSFEALEAAAAGIERSHAPIFLPFLFGERSPGWQADRRGGFVDMLAEHGMGALYYALLEGILFNLKQCDEAMNELLGEPEATLITGGIVHSPLWLQLAADIMARPLRVDDQPHASTMGAVAVAQLACGMLPSLEALPQPASRLVTPSPSPVLKTRYERYCHWYHQKG